LNASADDFVIAIDGLTKRFGSVTAVQDLTLRVPRGGVFGLLGPNGSGKTTTIGLLLGLIRPSAGSIHLFGNDARGGHLSALRRIGAIVENPAFYPDLSGRANLRYFQGIAGRTDAEEIERLLVLVDLAERADGKFRTYSLGMKQRLGIAYALLGKPELVFLDEPTNGLDPSGMAEVRDLIERLGRTGHTVVLSSHLLNEVEQVCDNVAILSRGRLITHGKVRDLLHLSGTVRLKTTANEQACEILGALDWVSSVRSEDGYLIAGVATDRSGEITRELSRQDVYVTEMVPLRVTLERYFLQVTGHEPSPAESTP
jgi:ABC-2 type transport system ATP-binding protein